MASTSASPDSVPVDEIKDLLTCSLCSKTLNEPRSLSCLHNFCKVCLGECIFLVRMFLSMLTIPIFLKVPECVESSVNLAKFS